MQNRFTSGGHVEENIQGGLVAQIENFLPQGNKKGSFITRLSNIYQLSPML